MHWVLAIALLSGSWGGWAAEANSEISAESREMVATGSIHGKALWQQNGPSPKSLAVRFLRPGLNGSVRPAVLSFCSLEGRSFRCDLPVETLDLAIVAPGFAPVYLWSLEVKRGVDRDLGTIRLSVGASVAGWVITPTTGTSPVKIRIAPEVTGWRSDPAAERAGLRSTETQADDRGFFQLTGLAPGAYRLTAERPDLAQAAMSIELRKGEERLLPQPLRLDPPITLAAFVQPTEAAGKALTCILEREVPRTNVIQEVARGKVGTDGECSASNLEPGRHTFRVVDSSHSTFYVSEIEVEPGMAPLSIDLDFVEVEGRVTVGDSDPLQGSVIFGTLNRQPNVTTESDEEGRFANLLPRGGEWPLDVVDAEGTYHAPTVDIRRRADGKPSWVDVKLPDTAISGTVREKGEPVADAIVLAQRQEDKKLRREAFTRSRKDGTFRLRGVRPGDFLLRAYTQTSSSRWRELHLGEDEKPGEIDLVLNRQIEVTVRVLGLQGPISGASVVAFPVIHGKTESWTHRGVTEADGQFAWTDVDGEAEGLDVLVIAAGYGVRMLRASLAGASGAPLAIRLDPPKGSLLVNGEALAADPLLAMEGAQIPLTVVLSNFLPAGLALDGKDGLTLDGFAPGTYSLCGRSQGTCKTGELREGERLSFSTNPE